MSTNETQTDIARATLKFPRHVAIIMDGNGRWAKKRYMPRFAGHKAGVEAVRSIVRYCANKGIEVLTLFAFSSENWRRPEEEVSLLMDLLLTSLQRQVRKLHDNNVRLRFIGDHHAFSPKLSEKIEEAEQLTRDNTGLVLVVAINYGGRWDITQAAREVARRVAQGEIDYEQIDEALMHSCMSLNDLPEPDLFIRTGGEQRVSNFLLWQLAYTELYFTDTLWPDFKEEAFELALESFARRQRRFGHTGEQMERLQGA
ncbi:MAG TPA: isoprenyl transferase [Gammaproteobacteria bacterium]|nr:isoprenyl transferase [Gammaproteobacteria bacterium]